MTYPPIYIIWGCGSSEMNNNKKRQKYWSGTCPTSSTGPEHVDTSGLLFHMYIHL